MESDNQHSIDDLANTFSALGDPRRLAIITRLQKQDMVSVTELCDGMDVSRQAVSKHLKMLTNAQIVSSEKLGRETLYSLQPSRFDEANSYLSKVVNKWDQALNRLKAHLE